MSEPLTPEESMSAGDERYFNHIKYTLLYEQFLGLWMCCETDNPVAKPRLLQACWLELPQRSREGGKAKRTCNRHDDCDEADAKYLQRHPGEKFVPYSFHCHDDCCEECFGN